jgi:hypothetical protein
VRTGEVTDVKPGTSADALPIAAALRKATMSPQLLYVITRQPIAELQHEAHRRQLSEILDRDARAAAIAERRRSR